MKMQIEAHSWEPEFSKTGINNPHTTQMPNSNANPDTNKCSNWHSSQHRAKCWQRNTEHSPFLKKVIV